MVHWKCKCFLDDFHKNPKCNLLFLQLFVLDVALMYDSRFRLTHPFRTHSSTIRKALLHQSGNITLNLKMAIFLQYYSILVFFNTKWTSFHNSGNFFFFLSSLKLQQLSGAAEVMQSWRGRKTSSFISNLQQTDSGWTTCTMSFKRKNYNWKKILLDLN